MGKSQAGRRGRGGVNLGRARLSGKGVLHAGLVEHLHGPVSPPVKTEWLDRESALSHAGCGMAHYNPSQNKVCLGDLKCRAQPGLERCYCREVSPSPSPKARCSDSFQCVGERYCIVFRPWGHPGFI